MWRRDMDSHTAIVEASARRFQQWMAIQTENQRGDIALEPYVRPGDLMEMSVESTESISSRIYGLLQCAPGDAHDCWWECKVESKPVVENSVEMPQKLQIEISHSTIPRRCVCVSKILAGRVSKVHPHSWHIHYSQKPRSESNPNVPYWMSRWTECGTSTQGSASQPSKGNFVTWHNMDELKTHYGECNKPITETQTPYDSACMRYLESCTS